MTVSGHRDHSNKIGYRYCVVVRLDTDTEL